MSDSVRPHRQQPTRLPHPWDSPGKNTGVGCHFLLQCMKVKNESEVAQSCPTLCDPMDCSPPGSSVHGIFQARVLEWGAIAFSGHTSSNNIYPIIMKIIRWMNRDRFPFQEWGGWKSVKYILSPHFMTLILLIQAQKFQSNLPMLCFQSLTWLLTIKSPLSNHPVFLPQRPWKG